MHKTKAGDKKAQEGWRGFINLCMVLNELKDPQAFFDLFFTAKEREDLAGRFLIVQELLKHEINQREMAEKLDVSIAKITRGSNELKNCSPEILAFIQQYMIASGSR